MAWLGLAEAALRSIRVFGTPEQLRLRLFEDSLATSSSQRRPDRSVTILADSLCNDTSQAAYGAAAAKAFSRLGTGIVTEFLFCDIALHFDSAAARQMAQGALPTGAVFRVNHTAIDERDEAMSTEQQRRVPRDRLTEFWTNMLIHIVNSEAHTLVVVPAETVTSWSKSGIRLINLRYQIVMRRGGLSAVTVRQYILDRFDLWNLLFPYSNIRHYRYPSATFLQFKAKYSLSVSNASVSKEEVHKTFSTGWDQRQLKSMLSNALLHNIEIVPASEPRNDRESALVYLFTMLSSTNYSSGNELSKLAQSQVSAKLLLDLEVNARGHRVSDIVSFETHAGLGRVRAASQLKIVDGFFVPVMHSNSFNKRRVYKLMPVLIKIRIEKNPSSCSICRTVCSLRCSSTRLPRKLETAFGAKRHYSALGVKAYSIDKLASNKFAIGIVSKIGLLNAQLDHDVLALLSDVRTAYDGAFSAPSGPPIRIMRLEHQLQISGLGFAGDAAAAGAQFSREFTQNFVCDSIGFIYNFETPSAISNCSCSFALSGTEQTKIFAKYTMTFSTAESSLFNQATVERVFNKGLLLFNAEFSGGHPMTSLSAWSLCPRPSAASLPSWPRPLSPRPRPAAPARATRRLSARGSNRRCLRPPSRCSRSRRAAAKSSCSGVGLGVVSAAGAVTAIAICLYLAWRLRSWRRNRQRLRMAAAPAEDTAAVNPRFQDDDSFSGAHLSLKSAKAPGSRQPQARLHRGSLSDSQRGSSSALLS
uniref:ANF_receptor domain-containing protein n=1 Tax=Macrostomum lignano TaxID=282301 RepID=A0A1I8IVZ8_9PLAT